MRNLSHSSAGATLAMLFTFSPGLFFLCPLSAQAQNLKFEQISLEKGLSHSIVFTALQDRKGFMWFGTGNGLNRYDGYTLKVYRSGTPSVGTLDCNTINTLWEGSDGMLWIGTAKGLNRFNPRTQTFTRYDSVSQAMNPDGANPISKICGDRRGNLWIGTAKRGVFHYRIATHTLTPVRCSQGSEPFLNISDLLEDSQGRLWASGFGLAQIDPVLDRLIPKCMPVQKGAQKLGFMRIVEGTDGQLWLGMTYGGLLKFDPQNGRHRHWQVGESALLPPDKGFTRSIQSISKDPQDNIWLGTDKGLYIVHPTNHSVTHYVNDPTDAFALSSNTINVILPGSGHIMWMGTFKAGVVKCNLARKPFQYLKPVSSQPNSAAQNNIYSIYETSPGTLWCGTWESGFYRLDRKSNHSIRYQGTSSGRGSYRINSVGAIAEDADHSLWVASWHGSLDKLVLANPGRYQLNHYNKDTHGKAGLSGWSFRRLYRDRQQQLWIASFEEGIFRAIPGKQTHGEQFIQYKHNPENPNTLSSNEVWTIYQDTAGAYWVGTEHGLDRLVFSADKQTYAVTHYLHKTGNTRSLSNNSVRVIHQDRKGLLWIGTGGGLNRLDPRTGVFSVYAEQEGLPNATIYGILEDKRGRLWLSTEQGLSCFTPATGRFRNYDVSDGLQSNEFNPGAFHQSATTGEMFFGGIYGITAFQPERIEDNSFPPMVALTDFRRFNASVPIGPMSDGRTLLRESILEATALTLSYEENAFSIEFTGLHYASPEKNRYAYQLEGFDKGWVYTTGQHRVATYTNLDPGTYRFRVKAANNDGVWSRQVRTLTLTITPPFWQTWWFCLGVLVMMVGTAAAFLHQRIRRVKRHQALLKQKVAVRTAAIKRQKERIEKQKDKLAHQATKLNAVNAQLRLRHQALQRQNREISHQRDRVKRMATQLHEADQLKLQFFTNVSHELRTPLTLIISPLERLVERAADEWTQRQYQMMLRNAKRLLHLINQIMDLRKLETGSMHLQARPEELVRLLRKNLECFRPLAESKQIHLVYEPTVQTLVANVDRHKLEQILTNLLSNAIKFTPAGGTVSVELALSERGPAAVGAQAPAAAAWTAIRVHDTGIGIPEKELFKVFNRFYQVIPDSSILAAGGTGIGLALVKELVHLHGGSIEVRSEARQGTTFIVWLPASNEQPPVTDAQLLKQTSEHPNAFALLDEPAMASASRLATSAKDRRSILLVEDNYDIRTYIRETLDNHYEIREAADGAEGLALAKKLIPDLVISDVVMPRMDGLKLCEKLKKDARTSHIPIILLTARTSDEDRYRGMLMGADGYVLKPFDDHLLKMKVDNLMRTRQKLEEQLNRQRVLQPHDLTMESTNEFFLKRAVRVVEDNIGNTAFGAEEFCRQMGVSQMSLYRKLQSLTGESANSFIRSIRLKRAAQLLSKQRFSVSEVAYQVGFCDLPYFSRCFRKVFGKTPKAYAESSDPNES